MLTPADFKTIITSNLNDDRIFAIQAFLTRLIARTQFGDGINQHRLKDTVTGNYVTSLADFITKLDATNIKPDFYYYAGDMAGDRNHPIAVTLSNFEIELNEHSNEDNIYLAHYGKEARHIMLLINYLADGDTILPLKIYDVRLI